MLHLLRRAPAGGPEPRAQDDGLAQEAAASKQRVDQAKEQITGLRATLRHVKRGGDLDLDGMSREQAAAVYAHLLRVVETTLYDQQQALGVAEAALRSYRREVENAQTMRRLVAELVRQLK